MAAIRDLRLMLSLHHLFAFPRFAVTSNGFDTRKAFIPFSPGAFANCPPGSGRVVQARATKLSHALVYLDRGIELDGRSVQELPYEYLVSGIRNHTSLY